MPIGKLASQACHAARLSLLHYLKQHPDQADEFRTANSVGSLVVLDAPDLDCLQKMSAKAALLRLPWALFVDSGHICPPAFDGSPIVTALAIGPALKSQINPITKHLRCLGAQS